MSGTGASWPGPATEQNDSGNGALSPGPSLRQQHPKGSTRDRWNNSRNRYDYRDKWTDVWKSDHDGKRWIHGWNEHYHDDNWTDAWRKRKPGRRADGTRQTSAVMIVKDSSGALEDKTKFVTFALVSVKLSTAHRTSTVREKKKGR